MREAIFERILTDQLPAGRSVGEVALGAELGASRTPLREALIELQGEGFLEHLPGRGFVVRSLSLGELREIYPIIAVLDALAIELAPAHDAALIERLRELNARLGRARAARRVAVDTEWHDALARASGNERLRSVLRTLRRVVQRYETSYLSDETLAKRSVREHEGVASALVLGKRDEAARLLRDHWDGSIERLRARLEQPWPTGVAQRLGKRSRD